MSGTRKLAAILAADVVGYSRLAGAEEERTLARLRALRGDLLDPAIAAHHGRVVKRTGDGTLVEFRSVVDAVRCAVEMQTGMVERNEGVASDRAIQFRIGVHLGDVIEEEDGDLMGDGVNIAARLEGIAEPGGICLSAIAYESVRDKIDAPFADLGERELKNIARPVRVYALSSHNKDATPAKAGVHRADAPPAMSMDPGFRRGGNKMEAPRLSIVVLPFANLGGDPEQDYFVDGVTESLTTDLSRISGSFVIARNTAFTYKGKPVDVTQIGRDLNVRYVLEGSVQRGGNRLRVNVQLIDAETGNHLWAERFDKPLADLFDMQDEIVAHLANQLRTEMFVAEAHRAARKPQPDSMDLYFQGRVWFLRGTVASSMNTARDFYQQALALDSGNLDALIGTASVDTSMASAALVDDTAARFARAEATLIQALSVAPNHAHAHFLLGHVRTFTGRAAAGIAEFERALALDGNLAAAHAWIGYAKIQLGRAEETEGHVRDALRLSPRDAQAYVWVGAVGSAQLYLGRFEESVAWYRRALDMNWNWPLAHYFLAAALALSDKEDEAQAAVRNGCALDPTFSIRRFTANRSGSSPSLVVQRGRIVEGMRKAGVPDG